MGGGQRVGVEALTARRAVAVPLAAIERGDAELAMAVLCPGERRSGVEAGRHEQRHAPAQEQVCPAGPHGRGYRQIAGDGPTSRAANRSSVNALAWRSPTEPRPLPVSPSRGGPAPPGGARTTAVRPGSAPGRARARFLAARAGRRTRENGPRTPARTCASSGRAPGSRRTATAARSGTRAPDRLRASCPALPSRGRP